MCRSQCDDTGCRGTAYCKLHETGSQCFDHKDNDHDGEVDWAEFCTAIEFLDNADAAVPAAFLATRLEAAQKDAQR